MSKMKQIAIDVAFANSLTLDEIKSRNRTASFSPPGKRPCASSARRDIR